MTASKKQSRRILTTLRKIAGANTVFYLMPPIMFVLFLGTVQQHSMGLFDAHQKYFSSAFFWIGPVPFPGGYVLIGLLSLSLLVKFILFSDWSLKKSGIILSHFGALILLFGGLITAIDQRESFMMIAEDTQNPYLYDYYETETLAYEDGQRHELSALPFKAEILSHCDNCAIKKREEVGNPTDAPLKAMARFMALEPKPREVQAEENLSGVTLQISDAQDDQDGIYITFLSMPKPITITHDDKTYQIVHSRKMRSLPFSLRLDDFEKKSHPGMMMAKGYSSDVTVIDDGIEWPTTISMNEPLRYKGYTFYQSAFEQTPETEITILSVVENDGRLFPYIGTLILALGLLLHFALKLMSKRKEALKT